MPKTVPHTFECPVAVRNLIADMRGDELQGHLPLGFGLDLALLMLRNDTAEMLRLHEQHANAGWSQFCNNDIREAERHKLACDYILTANNMLNGV